MRSANWWAISPGAALSGRPNTTCTFGRPCGGRVVPYGIAAYAPTRAIGSTGTFRLIDSAAWPGVKFFIAPVRERVPSGNSSSGTRSPSSTPATPRRLRSPLRSTGNALKNSRVAAAVYHLSKK